METFLTRFFFMFKINIGQLSPSCFQFLKVSLEVGVV